MEKYGFVYLWFDKKHKRYYVGCHWGTIDDGYICSSPWMKQAYLHRPQDFKRRILKTNIKVRHEMYDEEHRWLAMIKESEIKPHNPKPRYYNLYTSHRVPWHAHPNDNRGIGQKISEAKKGKSNGPCSSEKAQRISEAKKASFQKRLEETGSKFTPEHLQKMSEVQKGKKHTEEWKKKQSERSKKMWESRPRAKPKKTMTKEEQAAHTSRGLKSRWADPEWAARQRQKLKEGSARRHGKFINTLIDQ